MTEKDFQNYQVELEKLINLLDRVNSPQARHVIASRFQQIMAEIVDQIDEEAA